MNCRLAALFHFFQAIPLILSKTSHQMSNAVKHQFLIQVNLPTSVLLSAGGDDRITLDKSNGLNKYFCSTLPRSELIRRSSCTCSNIDVEDFKLADSERLRMKTLIENDQSADVEDFLTASASEVQNRIKSVLASSSSACEVVLFPSGSDAEYLPLLVAMVRNRNIRNRTPPLVPYDGVKVYNFVTGATEVGSGTPNAAEGKHFSKLAPGGYDIGMNERLDGVSESTVSLLQYKPRNELGAVAFEEAKLASDVDAQLSLDPSRTSVAIVHIVLGSKTGLVYPSMNTVDALRKKHGDRVIVVVDACQLRCKFTYVQWLVDQGFVCLVTGSKFFAAPPFCGAVLLPTPLASELESHVSERECVVPPGLSDYLTKFDVPITMPNFRKFLERSSSGRARSLHCNLGLLLRWSCSLGRMESYARLSRPLVPLDSRSDGALVDPVAEFTRYWVRRVQDILGSHGPHLRLTPVVEGISEDIHVGGANSIVSFSIFVQSPGASGPRFLDADECKQFYALMTTPVDASKHVDDPDVLGYLKQSVLLGQPVKLANNGLTVLRIALGADIVVNGIGRLFSADAEVLAPSFPGVDVKTIHALCEKALMEDQAVIKKAFYLAKYWSILTSPSGPKKSESLTPVPKRQRVLDGEDNPSQSAATTLDIVAGAVQQLSRTSDLPSVALLYDVDALGSAFHSVTAAFKGHAGVDAATFLHCFAMKSCPLPYVIQRAQQAGLGIETASLAELQQALRCGVPANRVMFDSPCKTEAELAEALGAGAHVNVNSLGELTKIAKVVARLSVEGITVRPGSVGLRINPLVGAGKIAALSTAVSSSKFGVRYNHSDATHRAAILALYREHSFLTGVMCHVGSQGMSIDAMVDGVCAIVDLADAIDADCGEARIQTIDIGGGLSANYGSDEVAPTFSEYFTELRRRCPALFTHKRLVVTEFGKSLVAKAGAILAKVEDVWTDPTPDGDRATVICHAGADLLLRTAYCPASFPHRVAALSAQGALKLGCVVTTVHGPLCFSGDVVAKDVELAPVQPGDYIVVQDAGANTISLFSRHCSRQAPSVYAFSRNQGINDSTYKIECIKSAETIEETLSFWD